MDNSERIQRKHQLQEAFKSLEEKEATLRSFIENAQHFALYRISFDPERPSGARLIFVSPSITEIAGIEKDQPFETWFEDIHPEDRRQVFEANRESMEKGESYNQTVRVFHRKKKQWVWVHTVSNPFKDPDGRLTYFDGMVVDVTDQMNLREIERLRQAAEGLREIIRIINSNRPLNEILNTIAIQANQLLQASSTMIRKVFREEMVVQTVASYNLPKDFDPVWETHFVPTDSNQILEARQPVIVEDIPSAWGPDIIGVIEKDNPEISGIAATVRNYKTLLKVPLFIKDRIFGAMTFHYAQPRLFHEEDLRLAMTLADQAALAIENADLLDQVKETAVMEERSRLARDLHDAVTQTLFSTTLTAEVLPRIWEKNPEEGRKKLGELRELTRGALAEMRTLLMELRPAAFAEAELKELLRHLVNAFIARSRIPVAADIQGDAALPLEIKEAFYRIAQETLNNIAKHSEADQVWVKLDYSALQIALMIRDNGQGFEVSRTSHDHLGLAIMRERAAQVGADYKITSQLGQGTTMTVCWRKSES